MKYLITLAILILLVGCTDYGRVMDGYKDGNPNAKELLLHGFNSQSSDYISSILIKRALSGDEEAKQMIYAQMEALRGMPRSDHRVTPVYIHQSRPACHK